MIIKKMDQERIKQRVQTYIIIISVSLMAGKFVAFFLTRSVGILTDALESIVNVTAGFITLLSLRFAARPKDAEHPFGHGKMEFISASIEGLLIFAAGGIIIFEGIRKIITPVMPQRLDVGLIIIAIAGLANWLAGWYSIRTGKKYNSMALVAGGKHLQSDTYSTIGLVIGLLLLYFTKLPWIDGLLAIIFGGIIVFTAIGILRKSSASLLDRADKDVLLAVGKVISENRRREWIDVHNLKVIRYGSFFYMDCDVTLPWYYTIAQGHDACDEMVRVLREQFSDRMQISVHSDSCGERHCAHCLVWECPYRKEPFVAPLEYTLDELTSTDEERQAAGEEEI